MARGRFISNSISSSKKFARLTSDRHRLAYLMLVPHVDAEGRHDADTRILAGQVYTLLDLTQADIEAALKDMHHVGLIHLYSVDGERYLEVVNFHAHNTVRRGKDGLPSHEAASTIPAPSDYIDNPAPTTEPLQSDYVAATAEVEVKVQVQDKVQVQEPRAHAREAGARASRTGKNPKKTREPTWDPANIPLPDNISPDVWRDFVDDRKARKRPLTPRAVELTLADLAKTPLDADEMLRTSIKRGWTGVFPLDKPRDGPPRSSSAGAAAWDAILAAAKDNKLPENLDPAAKDAMKAVGGWGQIAYCDVHQLTGRRAAFLNAYAEALARDPVST